MSRENKPTAKNNDICPVAGKCGGCQLQNMTYDRQLSYKQSKVISLMGRYCHVNEIIGMDDPYHYRNKVQAAFGMTRGGQIISGVYQSSTHNIVSVESCMLENETADAIIVTVKNLLRSFRLSAYNERSMSGFLRHVLVRTGHISGEVMVVLVTGTIAFPRKNDFIKALLEAHPEITTIVQNVNDKFTSMVLGDTQRILFGKGYITDTLCGLDFRISPKSFYQINPVQTEKLYMKAMEFASLDGNETVIDAYSGIGTIGLTASRTAGRVICVENNRDAVKDARVNAQLNGIENAEFYCEDAGDFMTKLAAAGEHIDVVFTDPPRAGCSKEFLAAAVKLSPDKIVYISCNPETQTRDLFYLSKNGYKVRKIQPVDMFPHTQHVETCVLLVRENVKDEDCVSLSLDLHGLKIPQGEYTPPEKPTYGNVKKWIKEIYGVNVSNLYIAQVKDKLGLEKRANYNLGEGKNKVPVCPEEKEAMIREAFKHFKLI